VLEPVTMRWDVGLGVLRGYHSETFAWSVAQRILASPKNDIYIYGLGDHDPSGVDAWRAFRTAVAGFLERDDSYTDDEEFVCWFAGNERRLTFTRLAVTAKQIAAWDLPRRPTKRSDSRSEKFVGDSVEVDAIPAGQLRQVVEDAITRHIDPHALEVTRLAETSERELLTKLISGN
jgi:hypothetical protein